MSKYATLVQETTTTTGTSDLVLAGATDGHRTLADPLSTDDYVNYLIQDADGAAWERGYGKFNGTTGLTRDYPQESSDAGSKITLTTGTHTVTIAPHPQIAEFRGYRLFMNAGQNITSEATTYINWTSEYEDTDSVITTSTTDLLVPDYVDRIRVTAKVGWVFNSTGYRRITICDLSGIPWPFSAYARSEMFANASSIHSVDSGIIPPGTNSGRGVKIQPYQNSGGVLAVAQYSWVCVEFVQ